jgi:hypothetical protein
MSYIDLALHAGHDGSLHLVVSDDATATGSGFVLRRNRLTTAGWSGWQTAGAGNPLVELGRYPDGRLVIFTWPAPDGDVTMRTETAAGSGLFGADSLRNPDVETGVAKGGFLVRGLADRRYEVFARSSYRALRSLQSAPGGSFPSLTDLDGTDGTPVDRIVCVGERPGGTPLLWGIDADGNLRGAQPTHQGHWAWGRRVDAKDRIGAAFYEGRRGPNELFYTTDRKALHGLRTVDLPLPQVTGLQVPVRRGTTWYGGVDPQHLLGHYSGDGRLYLFLVATHNSSDGTPAVIAETTPGSAWQANGAGWSGVQTPSLGHSQRVLRLAAGSFHTDGRLACAALMEDRTVRVSMQASQGSTSWSAWVTV